MSDETQNKFFTPSRFWKRELWIFLCGIVCGAGLLLIAAGLALKKNIIAEYHSPMPFDEAVQSFTRLIAEKMPGWTVSTEGCMAPKLPDGRRMIIFKLCNRKYAADLLTSSSRIAAVLPCAMTLQEQSDGSTALVRLNISLLSVILGGEAGRIFRDVILPEQQRLLDA